MCLFWGANLWLQPSRQMSTIQNPKKSWLTMKPACSLVDDASLGPRLPPSSLAALACLSLVGDGPVCSQLALLSPLFCERAWWCLTRSLLILMSIKSVMPSNHLILCHLLLLLSSIFPSIRVFSNESVLRIRWPKYWSFPVSASVLPMNIQD